MDEKILCVDDDPNILQGFKRQLRKKIYIDTALRGEKGLELVKSKGPYAVVVSDMKMPGMDGIQFLSKVTELEPDSIRVMLTGYANVKTAINAVNEGHIFRFLTKPCPPKTFSNAIAAGIKQYRLVMAERDLLEKTLFRSLKVMVDILSMVNPVAFNKTVRFRDYIKHMVKQLQIQESWKYELAATLSQIGCVTLPSDLLEKSYALEPLAKDEQKLFSSHPSVGSQLLQNIPRLEEISRMIKLQEEPFKKLISLSDPKDRDPVKLGAQMLKVAIQFDKLLARGEKKEHAIEKLLRAPDDCDPDIVSSLNSLQLDSKMTVVKTVNIKDLDSTMIINEDFNTKNGVLLFPKGQKLNSYILARIRNFLESGLVTSKVRVRIPSK